MFRKRHLSMIALVVLTFSSPAYSDHSNSINKQLFSGEGLDVTFDSLFPISDALDIPIGGFGFDFLFETTNATVGFSTGDIIRIGLGGFSETFAFDDGLGGPIVILAPTGFRLGVEYGSGSAEDTALDLAFAVGATMRIDNLAGDGFVFDGFNVLSGSEGLEANPGGSTIGPVTQNVPEPSSLVYLILGTVGLVAMGRRRRKRKLTT